MAAPHKQAGFTAVELLITLFVAAAFLIASYQLFNLVVKDGGATRSESRAANVAYDYLRQYGASSTTIPCTTSTPLNSAPITVDGLTSVTISVAITCLPDAISSLSKVEATITYNNPAQTVKYATYVSASSNTGASDITDGLIAWWKLNGSPNNSIGTPNGVATAATPVANQAGQNNMAYSFNGSTSNISTPSTFNLTNSNASISLWVYNPVASNHGLFVHVGASGYGIGMGNATTDANGTNIVMIFNGVRWIPTTTSIGVGWHHVAMVINGTGVPSAYLDGVLVGTYAGTASLAPTNSVTTIGGLTGSTVNSFNGIVDDVRLYNRPLSLTDVQALYSIGAK